MEDASGLTTYTYKPVSVGTFGAGRLAAIDGPLDNDTISYSYDELGRAISRSIGSVEATWTFDALARLTSETSVLGTFLYGYDGLTERIASVTYPNDQASYFSYFGGTEDRRLQTIHHIYPNGTTLSRYDYTYDARGNILTWSQQADSAAAVQWSYGYDAADQMVAAIKRTTDPSAAVLKRYAYRYDVTGNRTAEQIDNSVLSATFNRVNGLLSRQPVGPVMFRGTTNEPSTVTIGSVKATVNSANEFQAAVPITAGVNTIGMSARDASGNTTYQNYQLSNVGTSTTFVNDANGNLLSDGTRTFEWDARNQLAAVTVGSHRSEFTYNGLHQRVRIVEKESGLVQSDTRLVWCQAVICEERASAGGAVLRRVFALGEQTGGASHFFSVDHLSSVNEVTAANGSLLARYAFDPWGRRTVVAGVDVTNVGFTGYYFHGPSGTELSQYRAYDGDLGRWLSEDPSGLVAGVNRSIYANNEPVVFRDALGLDSRPPRIIPFPPPSPNPPPTPPGPRGRIIPFEPPPPNTMSPKTIVNTTAKIIVPLVVTAIVIWTWSCVTVETYCATQTNQGFSSCMSSAFPNGGCPGCK